MNAINECFLELAFLNGKDITKKILDEALVKNHHIHINLHDGHWSPNIYIPDDVPFNGGIIYITINSTFKSTIHVYNNQYITSKGEELVVLGSPTKKWTVVVPASSSTVS